MYVSPGWDIPYVTHHKPKTILTGILIEPGIIPVNSQNICANFGTSPKNFNAELFFNFVKESKNSNDPDILYNTKGWYMPIAFNNQTFIPYPNTIKYPHPNDIELIDNILPSKGYIFARVKSYVYHLQNYSSRNN